MSHSFAQKYKQQIAAYSQRPSEEKQVDVVINVYGKPYNTAATLLSLMQHSAQWIDKIYFIEERKQPHQSNFDFIKAAFGNKLICYAPKLWLWVRPLQLKWLFKIPLFRNAVRYQYGWEQSDKDFLFITHNDVLHKGDIVGALVNKIENNIGIGPVGQCWNCSASFAGLCSPDTYTTFKPDYKAVKSLLKEYPGTREKDYKGAPHANAPWPLPECRLNEWTALINLQVAREITMPKGTAVPFGAFLGLDIGTQWFSDVLRMGQTVKHFDTSILADHAWAGTVRSGHAALLNKDEYAYSEQIALAYLEKHI